MIKCTCVASKEEGKMHWPNVYAVGAVGRSGNVLRNMTVVSLMHSHSAGSPLATSFSLSGLSLTSTCILSILPTLPPPPLTASGPAILSHCTDSSPPIAPIVLTLTPFLLLPFLSFQTACQNSAIIRHKVASKAYKTQTKSNQEKLDSWNARICPVSLSLSAGQGCAGSRQQVVEEKARHEFQWTFNSERN